MVTTKKKLTEEITERVMQSVLDSFEEYHRMAEGMSKLVDIDDDFEGTETGPMDENIMLDILSEKIGEMIAEIVEDMVNDGDLNASTDS